MESGAKSKLKSQDREVIRLNFDILEEIFSYLDKVSLVRCALVCREWKDAAYANKIWSRTVFDVPRTGLTVDAAKSLKVRGVNAVCINQDWLSINPPMKAIGGAQNDEMYFAMLEGLKIPQNRLLKCKKQLTILLLTCINPLEVDTLMLCNTPCSFKAGIQLRKISCLGLVNVQITLERLAEIVSLTENLQQLYINQHQRLSMSNMMMSHAYEYKIDSVEALKRAIEARPTLRCLEFETTLWYASSPRLKLDVNQSPSLESLEFTESGAFRNFFIEDLAEKLPNLKHLRFDYDGLWASETPPKFLSLQSLRVLYKAGNWYKHSKFLFPLFKVTPNLVALDLREPDCYSIKRFGLKDEDITNLIETFPNLEVLNISGNRALNAEDVIKLPEMLPKLHILVAQDINLVWETVPVKNGQVCAGLTSFLVEHNPPWVGSLQSLTYKSVSKTAESGEVGSIYRLSDRARHDKPNWVKVSEGSRHWDNALGLDYFRVSDKASVFRKFHNKRRQLMESPYSK